VPGLGSTAQAPYGYGPPPQPPATRRGPNAGLLVLVGVLVTAVIALAVVLLVNSDGTPDTPPTSPPVQAGGASPGGQSPSSAAPTTPPATPENPGNQAPPGLRQASGPGYTIAVPPGWIRSDDGNSVFWRDPNSNAYVQVDRTPWSGDPLSHWEQWEQEVINKGALKDYNRIDLRTPSGVPYEAADIEFTWTGKSGVPMHGIDRGVIAAGRPFAVFVAIPADQWADSRTRVNNILGSFRP
jgi:hypothetical protein